MNPSTSGWIDKFNFLAKENSHLYSDFETLYNHLKTSGFIYGINISTPRFIKVEHLLSEDENAKINLLNALYFTYCLKKKVNEFNTFLKCILEFYELLEISNSSLIDKIFIDKKTSSQLEKLINARVYLEDNIISKNFNNIITNSLLFVDVLCFKKYLEGEMAVKKYAQNLEYITINIAYETINTKEKNKKDERLAQLFSSSLTYIESDLLHFDNSYREKLKNYFSDFENQYFLDVACLTIWKDNSLQYKEFKYIFDLGNDLGFHSKKAKNSLDEITYFFKINLDEIPYLKEHNFAMQFYDSMSKIVKKLILRNSKRLQKELAESKELVALISKSTVKNLSVEEKKKMQKQLADIFKTIPSLAIFLLPGGAVLLPIFIKLIPKLLPSTFDDNRID